MLINKKPVAGLNNVCSSLHLNKQTELKLYTTFSILVFAEKRLPKHVLCGLIINYTHVPDIRSYLYEVSTAQYAHLIIFPVNTAQTWNDLTIA